VAEPAIRDGHGRREHDADVEPAFARQRARRDQRRVPRAGQADTHDRDEDEQDYVLGQAHIGGAFVIGAGRARS
jgi:hypothetical protein